MGQDDISEEAARDARTLASWISVYTFVPVALGLRKSSLRHKIAGFLHGLFLCTGSVDRMTEFVDDVVSVTTDLGTEAGLAEFHNSNIRTLLTPWLQLTCDPEPDGEGLPDCRTERP